ncbi:hypothetical protein DM02DRAFT_511551 [Periconia macrospinosa]|uniref:Pentacotripeptide-repeat region of PRORP domain-containing protein n=1 Tax=Periconia macrospinosa TaxID=97972 RepID=A0A2V1EBS0_9PLEO|nr:hypothetical protein DM02DRAFT_511551 [Periconia macrospinosa]
MPAILHRTATRPVPLKTRPKHRIDREPKLDVGLIRKVLVRNSGSAWLPFEVRRRKTQRALRLQIQRYLQNTSRDDRSILQNDGRYRSLRRRHLNFKRSSTESMSLNIQEGRLDSVLGRLRAFASLDYLGYPKQLKNITHELRLQHDQQCPSWISMLFPNGDSTKMAENWMSFEPDLRAKIWPYLLIYLLEYQPDWALQFIRMLIEQPKIVYTPKLDMIADALTHISSIYTRRLRRVDANSQARDAEVASQLVPICYYFMQCGPAFRMFSQSFFYNMTRLADIEDLKLLLELLEGSPIFLLSATHLQFANTFAKAGEQDFALRCLKAVRSKTNDFKRYLKIVNREPFRWSCALLLRLSSRNGQNYHDMPALVAQIVEMGVQLDTLLYNVIMKNAMEAGDYSTAFQVFNTLSDHGLTPTEYTFATLLYGCTTSNEPAKYNDYAEHCLQQAKTLRYQWLAADYLYYHYICSYRSIDEWQDHDFQNLLGIYSEIFDTGPLELFFGPRIRRPATSEEENDTTSTFEPLPPVPLALYIMLQARIQVDLRISYHRVWELYLRFEKLVREKANPHINEMAMRPMIWNAFLLVCCRNQQFSHASHIMEEMRARGRQPNRYSWTMMMQAFFRAGQTAAGERIYGWMMTHGIEVTNFTHGAILIEYARNERYEDIGKIMDHADSEQLDPDVLGALGKVRDRWALLKEMQESEKRKKQEREADNQKMVDSRVARWRSLLEKMDLEMLKGREFKSLLPPAKQQTNEERSAPSSDAPVAQ